MQSSPKFRRSVNELEIGHLGEPRIGSKSLSAHQSIYRRCSGNKAGLSREGRSLGISNRTEGLLNTVFLDVFFFHLHCLVSALSISALFDDFVIARKLVST